MHTQGQVVDCHYDNLPMPVVEFIVNGTPHQVKGPEFKVSVINPEQNDQNNNLNLQDLFSRHRTGLEGATRDILPQKVTVYCHPLGATDIANIAGAIDSADALKQQAAQIASRNNPLSALYPIGSTADVYYDSNNPELAYVQWPLGVSAFDYVVIAVGVILCIVGIVTLII